MSIKNFINATRDFNEKKAKEAASHAARMERLNSILDEAAEDPEKFIRIIRTQMGREQGRVLFTYRQVSYRAQRDMLGGVELMTEFFRQERGEEISEAEVSDEQLEALWDNGVSLGRIFSSNPGQLAAWYRRSAADQGKGPYVSVQHWARAYRVASTMGLEAVVFTLTELMWEYHNQFIKTGNPHTLDELVDEYEEYAPGFKSLWGTAVVTAV